MKFCEKCGTANDGGAEKCIRCAAPFQGGGDARKQSIFSNLHWPGWRFVGEWFASTARGLTLHQRTAVVLAAYAVLLLGFRLSGHGKPVEGHAMADLENESTAYEPFHSYGMWTPPLDYSAELALANAEGRAQDARDEAHDRKMSWISGNSLEQEKAMDRAGIVSTLGSDSYGKIGKTGSGEIIRTDSNGRQKVLENGRWYNR